MAGYSGKPLITKLGVKPGARIHVKGAPEDYFHLLHPLPEGVKLVPDLTRDTDFVHIFSSSKTELEKALKSCRAKLKASAAIWVSWPKKSAKLPTDITENTIRELALPLGFVDVKVCDVTEVWSGLKLVVRTELR